MAAANWLRAQAVESAVLESPANFHHLFYHAFLKRELNAHILNPMTIKALLAVEGKSDKADAINMARLAAHFRLRASNIPDDMQREIRMNPRMWDADKAARARASNSLRSLLTAYRVPIFRQSLGRKAAQEQERPRQSVYQAAYCQCGEGLVDFPTSASFEKLGGAISTTGGIQRYHHGARPQDRQIAVVHGAGWRSSLLSSRTGSTTGRNRRRTPRAKQA